MTPAIALLKKKGIPHQVLSFDHDPKAPAYGLEAAQAFALPPGQVFKTLIAQLDGQALVMALVPVDQQLDLKKLARAAHAKKADMAGTSQAQKATGYLVGGISPLGQKKHLALYLDQSAGNWPSIYVSGGRRGLEVALAPADLLALAGGRLADLGRP